MVKKQIIIAAALLFMLGRTQTTHATKIIGIYNNLPEGGDFVVTTDLSLGAPIGKAMPYQTRMNLPAKIYVNQGRGSIKTIVVREQEYDPVTSKACAGKRIEAFVVGYENETRQVICATSAENEDYLDLKSDFLQNIIVALARRDKTDTSWPQDLNFKFGISAWSSTASPWDAKDIATTANNINKPFLKDNKPSALTVLQGYNGWGNGTLPQMGHAHLVHIYNNTPYMLIMKRRGTSSQINQPWRYFEKAVPPYSAIPWAMAWIPKVSSDKINKGVPDIGEISILTLGTKFEGKIPPSLKPITDVFGEQADDITEDTKKIVERMKDSVPDLTEKITGQKDPFKDFLKEPQFFTGAYLYKVITDEDENKIKVQRCNMVNKTGIGSVAVTNCQTIFTSKTKAFGEPNPKFYSLIINPYERPANAPERKKDDPEDDSLTFEFDELTVDEL